MVQPISSSFYIKDPSEELANYNSQITELQSDEKINPENTSIDEKDISYYRQEIADLEKEEGLASAYRQSNNDSSIGSQIEQITQNDQVTTQLVGLDTYIKQLQVDSAKNPQDKAMNDAKIANAEQQESCILQLNQANENYQHSKSQSDADTLNNLILQLQQLRSENPTSPYSNQLIFEDMEIVSSNPNQVFEYAGQKYISHNV